MCSPTSASSRTSPATEGRVPSASATPRHDSASTTSTATCWQPRRTATTTCRWTWPLPSRCCAASPTWPPLDRAVDLVHHGALHGDVENWAAQGAAIRRDILEHAWNSTIGAFTATIGGAHLDAAALVAPLIGFLPPDDPRCRATRTAITVRLGDEGLPYDYDDGLGEPEEGAFLLCTLWLANTHAIDGEADRGEELLDRILVASNDLGLLVEEADAASGHLLGNFPQGLTHLRVIDSAIRLDAAR